jgi:hypothetical protein
MIKYIHLSLDTKHYNGITIAYEVYDHFVKFSYAITMKPDQYSKKIGRQITVERFNTSSTYLNGEPYNVNLKEMTGIISREYALDHIGFNGCLKENFIQTLSLTDIKLKAVIPTICKVIDLHNDEIYGTI